MNGSGIIGEIPSRPQKGEKVSSTVGFGGGPHTGDTPHTHGGGGVVAFSFPQLNIKGRRRLRNDCQVQQAVNMNCKGEHTWISKGEGRGGKVHIGHTEMQISQSLVWNLKSLTQISLFQTKKTSDLDILERACALLVATKCRGR